MTGKPVPQGIVAAVQRWVDLREARTVAIETSDDYDLMRDFEERQQDAAGEALDMMADWLASLRKLR